MMTKCIITALTIVLLVSCKAHVCGIDDSIIHDTISYYQIEHDSVMLHDSIYNEVVIKGDSVTIYKYREHVVFRDRMQHDSLYIHKNDTIIVTKQAEKKMTPLQQLQMGIGTVGLCIFIMAALIFSMQRLFR